MTYLLDTSVVCELRKRQPDPRVLVWYGGIASAELFISVLAIGEIRLGIERLRRKDTAQADFLEQRLRGLQVAYADHIVDVDTGIADQRGRRSVPGSLPGIDGLLAASAKARGWTLVTRNVADLAPRDRLPAPCGTGAARSHRVTLVSAAPAVITSTDQGQRACTDPSGPSTEQTAAPDLSRDHGSFATVNSTAEASSASRL